VKKLQKLLASIEAPVPLVQVQKVTIVHCKVEMGPNSRVFLTSGPAASAPHLSASVAALRGAQMTPEGALRGATATPTSPLLTETAWPRETSGPLAGVMWEEYGDGGYCCHPAVADNSMHIGILVGRADGKTRIPGQNYDSRYPRPHSSF
jgi:hypothetical protein